MKKYLPRYLVIYAVLGAVFAMVSALVRFPSMLGILIPGLIAALVAGGYVNEHLQQPTTREKAEFAALAAGISAVIGTAMMVLALGIVRQAVTESSDANRSLEPSQMGSLTVILFVLNLVTIYIGTGFGARAALNRIAHPDPPTRHSSEQNRGVSNSD